MGSISTCVSYPGKVLTAECIGEGGEKEDGSFDLGHVLLENSSFNSDSNLERN